MTSATEPSWTNRPPPNNGRFIPIVRAPAEGRLKVVSVSLDLVGREVHWNGERTVPCQGGRPLCPLCKDHAPKKWLGYLGCWLPEVDRIAMLEVTAEAVDHCYHFEPGLLGDLRGWEVHAYRVRPSKHSRVVIEFVRQVDEETPVPPPFDVGGALERIWRGGLREAPAGG